jgi:PKD repeat protein
MEYSIQVNTHPAGLIVLVDNSWVNTPAFSWWKVSSVHNLTVNATQSGLVFESWSHGALISHTVTITEPTTYVANFVQTSELTVTVTPSSTKGESPLTVQFDVDTSGGIPPYTYSWDFGDGAVSNEADVVHIFSEPGLYEVRLVVVDSSSPSKNVTKIIHITVESPESTSDLLGYLVWVVVIAIIVVIVIVALLLWRRKRSEPDEEGEESTDDEATSEDEAED